MIGHSIVERLSISDVLRLADRKQPNARGYFRCAVHDDAEPSAHVVPKSNGRGWTCFVCGNRGGILDLAVALGIGNDHRSAARELEARLR